MKNKGNITDPSQNAKQYLTILTFLTLATLITSCDQFEFSPNQSFDHASPSNLNAQNLARLRRNAEDDTVAVVFAGDTQRWYDEQERFVRKVNSLKNVDLVLLAGDISDFGLLQEFKWVHKRLSALRAPYFGIIGNHDMVANGRQIFQQMFGPLNYSFVYGASNSLPTIPTDWKRPAKIYPTSAGSRTNYKIPKVPATLLPFPTCRRSMQWNSGRSR